MASIEVKVRKLDGELARYKDQMSKLRNGPGKVRSILLPPTFMLHGELLFGIWDRTRYSSVH